MNDYVQRSDVSPVDRSVPRPVAPVSAVVKTDAAADSGIDPRSRPASLDIGEGADIEAGSEAHLASAAEYARVHAQVANILASVRSSGSGGQSIASMDAALTALTPVPTVIVPLPPASLDMVEQAAKIAQKIVDQATLAHYAQAHVKPGTVDQILSQVA